MLRIASHRFVVSAPKILLALLVCLALYGPYITYRHFSSSNNPRVSLNPQTPLKMVSNEDLQAAILAAVANHRWEDAIAKIKLLHVRTAGDSDRALLAKQLKEDETVYSKTFDRVLRSLEQERSFLGTLSESVEETAPGSFLTKLAEERIVVNFYLIALLDPEVPDQAWSNSDFLSQNFHAQNDDISWFWKGVSVGKDYYSRIEKSDWRARSCIPVDSQGNPLFFDVPESYSDKLGCGEQILYLANEIEQLDPTTAKHHAGRIMLYRARLAMRLFGPVKNPEWDTFTYDIHRRPSFMPVQEIEGMRPLDQLDDDETRMHLGPRLDDITLPAQHSPLFLYRQLEDLYPNCDCAARAMYEIGQFYQMRRQFKAAVIEYQRVEERFPNHKCSQMARQQIGIILRPDVLLGRTGVYLTGAQPRVWFTYRNTTTVDFTLRSLNFEKLLRDQCDDAGDSWRRNPTLNAFDSSSIRFDEDALSNAGDAIAKWQVTSLDSTMVAATSSTLVPYEGVGEYLLEARIPGTDDVSYSIILQTSVALTYESQTEMGLLRILDARTGERLPNESLQVLQFDHMLKGIRATEYKSNDAGEVVTAFDESEEALVYVTSKTHGKAFLELGYSRSDPAREPIEASYTVTDRPAYRPGETVRFRSWYRRQNQDDPLALPAIGTNLRINVLDPVGKRLKTLELKSDETGSVEGTFELEREAKLGEYRIHLECPDDLHITNQRQWWDITEQSSIFRVEEYKRPEYQVKVIPSNSPLPDNQVGFDIEAAYYFGEPVEHAEVEYTLYVKPQQVTFATAQPYDWLYGVGYGRYNYLYPWLGDNVSTEPFSDGNRWRNFLSNNERGTKLESGTTQLDARGRAELRFDTTTTGKPSNEVVQYTLVVSVRDDSRRSISAEGTTIKAKRGVFAFAELDRGWYEPGDSIQLTITTLDPDHRPKPTKLQVELSSIEPVDSRNETVNLTRISEQGTTTGDDGISILRFNDLPVGQYRAKVQIQPSLNLARKTNSLR